MRRTAESLCLTWIVALLGCRVEVTSLHAGSSLQVGNDGFSIELPPGRDWRVVCSETSITLEHRDQAGFSTIGSTLIQVSAHSAPPVAGQLPEEEIARQFMASELEKAYGGGHDFQVVQTMAKGTRDPGRTLYGVSYSARSRPSWEDRARGDPFPELKREMVAYFPNGACGPAFYSFDVLVARSRSWPIEWDSLRLIDGVIDSFRVTSVPKERGPAVRGEVDP